MWHRHRLILALLAAVSLGAAGGEPRSIADLRAAAAGPDPIATMAAVKELASRGEPASAALRETAREMLLKDAGVIRKLNDAPAELEQLKKLVDEIAKVRADARLNIEALSKDKPETIKAAHEFFKQLVEKRRQVDALVAPRAAALDALSRRSELLSIYRKVADKSDSLFGDAEEAKLVARVEKAMGASLKDLATAGDWKKQPKDPFLRQIWLYRFSRAIEAFNAKVAAAQMDPGEAENAHAVNVYRETLGILPYELDPRLIQAARRHAKEMIDKDYFSHESPTEGHKSFGDRAALAGYKGAAGENIAFGPRTGEKAFWMWFDSPGHHQNMANPSASALGVGKWNNHWTQVFGNGKRAMLTGEPGEVKGEPVLPQK
jgi:hypothetical protein